MVWAIQALELRTNQGTIVCSLLHTMDANYLCSFDLSQTDGQRHRNLTPNVATTINRIAKIRIR